MFQRTLLHRTSEASVSASFELLSRSFPLRLTRKTNCFQNYYCYLPRTSYFPICIDDHSSSFPFSYGVTYVAVHVSSYSAKCLFHRHQYPLFSVLDASSDSAVNSKRFRPLVCRDERRDAEVCFTDGFLDLVFRQTWRRDLALFCLCGDAETLGSPSFSNVHRVFTDLVDLLGQARRRGEPLRCVRGETEKSSSPEPVSYTHLTLPTILRV